MVFAQGPLDDTAQVFTTSDCYWVMVEHPTGAVAEQPSRALRQLNLSNPIMGQTTVPGHLDELFALYDVTGKLVARQSGRALGAGLAAGIYTVRSGAGLTARVVKLN